MLSQLVKKIAILSSVTLLVVACNSKDINSIPPSQAATLQSSHQAIIVDVREDNEWQQQHIPGAIHIPLQQLNARMSELAPYKNSTVIMQCKSGGRSAKAVDLLKTAGFNNVANMDGGIIAWNKAGLKTE